MRFPIRLLVCGFLALTAPVAEAAPVRKIVPKGATNFTSKTYSFSIWLPKKPTQYEVFTASPIGVFPVELFRLESGHEPAPNPLTAELRTWLFCSGNTPIGLAVNTSY